MKKVIVTGGAGFIGSHTVVALHEAGYVPVLVDDFRNSEARVLGRLQKLTRPDLKNYRLDCGNAKKLQQVFDENPGAAGVIHFAASKSVSESVKDPFKYYENNVGAMITVLRGMGRAGIRNLVFSSSCTVYGQPDTLPVTEETPMRAAESPYGFSKQINEAMIRDAVRAGQALDAVILRYFNPIGAHPSGKIGELPKGVPENLVPYITQTAAGWRPQLTVFGNDYPTPDGSCIRDYIHVMDLAEAHVAALRRLEQAPGKGPGSAEVFNVGTGKGSTVLEAIKAFEEATGRKLEYAIGPRRPGDIVQIYAAVDKSKRDLGWRATRTLVDAMRDAWRWQKTLKAPKKT